MNRQQIENSIRDATSLIEGIYKVVLWVALAWLIIPVRAVARHFINLRQRRATAATPTQQVRAGLLEWLSTKVFKFNHWGETLRNDGVKSIHHFLSVILVIIGCVVFTVWMMALPRMMGSYWIAAIIAMAMALVIVVLERFIVVADMRWKKIKAWALMTLRIAVAVSLAMAVSDPAKRRSFKEDIDAVFNDQELALRTKLLERGHKKIGEDYAKRIKQAEKDRDLAIDRNKTAQASGLSITTQGIKQRIAELDRKVKEIQDIASAEGSGQAGVIYGWRLSGKRGVSVHTKMALAEADKWRNEIKRLSDKLPEESRKSSAKTASITSNETGKTAKEIAQLQKDQAKEVAGLAKLSNQQLAKKYGGKWQVSRGYLAQGEILEELAQKEKTVWWRLFAISLFFIVLDLLPMLMKLMVGERLANYNSTLAQAAAGNMDAWDMLKADGYTEEQIGEFTRASEVRQAEANVRDRQLAMLIEHDRLQARVARLCKPRWWLAPLALIPWWSHRRWRQLPELNAAADAQFDRGVAPALIALHNAESAVERLGAVLPAWPSADTSREDTHRRHHFTEADFRALDWVNPELPISTPRDRRPLDRDLSVARAWWVQVAVIDAYQHLLNLSQEQDQDGCHLTLDLVQGRMEQYWETTVRPVREAVALVEARYDVGDSRQAGNAKLPPWPFYLNYGRAPSPEAPRVTFEQLQAMGWQDPNEQREQKECDRQALKQAIQAAELQEQMDQSWEAFMAGQEEEEKRRRQAAEAEATEQQKLLCEAEEAERHNSEDELVAVRQQFEELETARDATLRRQIRQNPEISYLELKYWFEEKLNFRRRFTDLLRELEHQQRYFTRRHWSVPSWILPGCKHCRTLCDREVAFAWRLPSEEVLRAEFDWLGPEGYVLVVKSHEPPPPPTDALYDDYDPKESGKRQWSTAPQPAPRSIGPVQMELRMESGVGPDVLASRNSGDAARPGQVIWLWNPDRITLVDRDLVNEFDLPGYPFLDLYPPLPPPPPTIPPGPLTPPPDLSPHGADSQGLAECGLGPEPVSKLVGYFGQAAKAWFRPHSRDQARARSQVGWPDPDQYPGRVRGPQLGGSYPGRKKRYN